MRSRDVRRSLVATLAPMFVGVVAANPAVAAGIDFALGGSPLPATDGSVSEPKPTDDGADEGVSSASTAKESREANPAHYEFAFVSMGAYQTWAIAGRWLYLGVGGGVGPPLYRYSKLGDNDPDWDPSLEVVYGNGFVRLAPIPYVDFDLGPKVAIVSTLYGAADTPATGVSYGAYVDLRVGSKTIKLGPRFEYDRIAYFDAYDKGWRLTPLMLRLVH